MACRTAARASRREHPVPCCPNTVSQAQVPSLVKNAWPTYSPRLEYNIE